jgi:hypothetical protein
VHGEFGSAFLNEGSCFLAPMLFKLGILHWICLATVDLRRTRRSSRAWALGQRNRHGAAPRSPNFNRVNPRAEWCPAHTHRLSDAQRVVRRSMDTLGTAGLADPPRP